ncbi:MAG: hypothetical protein SWE60_00980 [Thermodesulfobacteriota bacterium]|nr:hypothetical protein [Thermodesulfobacteriota bacterium]
MADKKRVLIISFHYPPSPAATPSPVYSWAKYLRGLDWEPILLATEYGDSVKKDAALDYPVFRTAHTQAFEKLVTRRLAMSSDALSFKLLNFMLITFLLYPDEKRGWFSEAYRQGLSILRDHPVSVILSSGAPWTDFWVANRLSRKMKIPWIAHYRDPWTQRTSQGLRFKWLIPTAMSRVIEKSLIGTAHCCLHASDLWAAQLSAMTGKRVYWLPNGYDPDDFQDVSDSVPDKEALTISYVGTLHFPQRLDPFFRGFEKFVLDSKVAPGSCVLNFIGTPHIESINRDYPLIREYARFIPYVSKPEAIQCMSRSHVLLLFLSKDTGWYPAKTYEYLASHRVILASPDNGGVMNRLLRGAEAGVVLDTPSEIASWLNEKMAEFRKSGQLRSSTRMDAVREFDRKRQTARLAQILNGVSQ